MKIGIEVEGQFKGLPMIFCEADEIGCAITEALDRGVDHLYISDKENKLDYDLTGMQIAPLVATVEVTKVTGPRPNNVMLMLRDPSYAEVEKLSVFDQIKFERDRRVFVFPMAACHHTYPDDFAGDKEI